MQDSILQAVVRSSTDDSVLRPDLFQPYVQELASLFSSGAAGIAKRRTEFDAALDGQPGRELRKLYSIRALRSTGTYFTSSELANRLVAGLKLSDAEQIVDPACGAGDLLVACARHLPVHSDLTKTLREWGKRLAGFDINPAFVEATQYRLGLLALTRSAMGIPAMREHPPLTDLFPNIRSGSGIENWNLPASPSLIVVNPPFSYAPAAAGCIWGSGQVSQAASFLESCVKKASAGTRLLAILPDVLRTGTRYQLWRRMVEDNSLIRSVRIEGQFDKLTDVSVFFLELKIQTFVKKQRTTWALPSPSRNRTVKDLFDVRVGPVVPFRLDGCGRWLPYAHSEVLPPWKTVTTLEQRIRFAGTTYAPPFVLIRRTSKPNYQFRCIGTLVTGDWPVAIENHLLVVMPHDKKVSTCRRLLRILKDDSTSQWMNERIRCRHLTVSSIGDLPWPED